MNHGELLISPERIDLLSLDQALRIADVKRSIIKQCPNRQALMKNLYSSVFALMSFINSEYSLKMSNCETEAS